VTLTDTGPLVALINRNDPHHLECIEAVKGLPSGPLITTWPCFTETMYLLHKAGGLPAQAALWLIRKDRRLLLHHASEAEEVRMATLMATYHDLPMDLADASLVAAAESLPTRRVFTLDQDFHVYRLNGVESFEVVPIE
jgi:predicted nucleic acid-binding protein